MSLANHLQGEPSGKRIGKRNWDNIGDSLASLQLSGTDQLARMDAEFTKRSFRENILV